MKSPVLSDREHFDLWANAECVAFVEAPKSYPCVVVCDSMANWVETVYYHEIEKLRAENDRLRAKVESLKTVGDAMITAGVDMC